MAKRSTTTGSKPNEGPDASPPEKGAATPGAAPSPKAEPSNADPAKPNTEAPKVADATGKSSAAAPRKPDSAAASKPAAQRSSAGTARKTAPATPSTAPNTAPKAGATSKTATAPASGSTPKSGGATPEPATKTTNVPATAKSETKADAPIPASRATSSEDQGKAATKEAAPPTADSAAKSQDKPEPPARRGGVVPLVLGGAVAAGLGFGAAYLGLVAPAADTPEETAQLDAQAEDIAGLEARITDLAETPPDVDLSAIEAAQADMASQLSDLRDTIGALQDRVGTLEDRPVLTGDAAADTESVIAALDGVQARLAEQEAENQAMAEDMRRIAEETQASIAAAEDRAQASLTAARAQVTISRVRAALAAGVPFAGVLADLPEGVEVPADLAQAADTGVPRLSQLQARFPAAAREALPVSIRDTAQDTPEGDRFTAFVRSQLGVRSITPRDGTDPDAILSRAQAAVSAGDLDTALAEIGTLPQVGQDRMADWVADARARLDAEAAIDALSTSLTLN